MKLSFLISASPNHTERHQNAISLVRASLEAGYVIEQVFFWRSAVSIANRYLQPPRNELNIQLAWIELAKEFDLDLVVCIASALRRGVLSDSESQRHGLEGNTLHSGFMVDGLGALIEDRQTADRRIEL